MGWPGGVVQMEQIPDKMALLSIIGILEDVCISEGIPPVSNLNSQGK